MTVLPSSGVTVPGVPYERSYRAGATLRAFSPAHEYRLRENAGLVTFDDVARVNGIYNGNVTHGRGGVRFDGLSGHVRVASALADITDVTMLGWFHIDVASMKGALLYNGNDLGGYGFGIGNADLGVAGNELIGIYGNVRWIDSNVAVGLGWHQLGMALDGASKPSMILDGAYVYTDALAAPNPVNPGFTIGAMLDPTNIAYRFISAAVADVDVFARKLSAPDLAAAYETSRRYGPYRRGAVS